MDLRVHQRNALGTAEVDRNSVTPDYTEQLLEAVGFISWLNLDNISLKKACL